MTSPTQTDDARALLELETSAHAEVLLPVDAHVIGEPVTVTQIRYPRLPRVGLLATCRRGELTYELSLADVVFPTGSAGAALVARYRALLGLAPLAASGPEVARPHKVEVDDIVVGEPIDLVVLACKSNALRCRLVGSARVVTLRTAVRDEIRGLDHHRGAEEKVDERSAPLSLGRGVVGSDRRIRARTRPSRPAP
jgi:hypothetical protein